MAEFGPWIYHDGKGCPVPVGTVLNTVTETLAGKFFEATADVKEVDFPAYDWSNWQAIGPGGFKWGRVVRYRIRKPRGLKILEQRLTEIDTPVREVTA